MITLKKAARIVADFFEIWLPGALFLVMFLVFVYNIVMRYIFKDSQIWALEYIQNTFLIIALLSACIAFKKEDLVVFDLVYARLHDRGKNVMRIVSNAIIIIGISAAIPSAVKYVWEMPAVTYQLKIPQNIFFSSIPILFISSVLRAGYRFVLDVKALMDKTYIQRYNVDVDKETLV